jgi:hypothetical protein
VTDQHFTPTAYRSLTTVPSYAGQAREVVALRARPRGTGEWAIWDTFAVTQSPAGTAHGTLTMAEVVEMVRHRELRTPGYELELLRASLVSDGQGPV